MKKLFCVTLYDEDESGVSRLNEVNVISETDVEAREKAIAFDATDRLLDEDDEPKPAFAEVEFKYVIDVE